MPGQNCCDSDATKQERIMIQLSDTQDHKAISYWRLCLGAALLVTSALVHAQMPYLANPPNEPGAIVKAMIARDLKNMGRYSGGQDIEYTPLFESYPPYIVKRKIEPNGRVSELEEVPTFGACAQTMLVKSIKVKEVLNAPDPLSPVGQPKALPNDVLVVLQAEVLALHLWKQDAIPERNRCSWLGLEVQNTKTGKRESYFDNVDDDQSLLKMMKQFGETKGDYIIVDPHRRHWEYAVAMQLPRSGKGLRRHYLRDAELGKRQYVDAVEPRWLIQEPYPPEAWHISVAVKNVREIAEGIKQQALSACAFAIAKASGGDVRKVSKKLEDPACVADASVQRDLANARRRMLELQIVKDIESGAKQ